MLIEPIHPVPGGAEAELRFAAPLAEVFRTISDLHSMERWWPEHRTYRLLRGDGGAGSLYGWTYWLGLVPTAGLTRVLAREPDARFRYRAGFPGMGIELDYRFRADGEGTRASVSLRSLLARLPGFHARLLPEMARSYALLEELLRASPAAAA
jgi:uncharacterized protein YndB with AHSA1/START domain